MNSDYYTVAKRAEKEIVIKKSRFIAYISPTSSENDAEAFIEEIKKKHRDAAHNIFAYIIGDKMLIQRASDDGEPSGTAGKPTLEVIKNKKLTNITVVVTRYFGGIKLGTGGLIRAYSRSAAEGIEKAGEVIKKIHKLIIIKIDYSLFGSVQRVIEETGYKIEDVEYTDKVSIKIFVPEKDSQKFIKHVIDLTNDRAEVNTGQAKFISFKRYN
jgi:uncharacterized YigZ family protein